MRKCKQIPEQTNPKQSKREEPNYALPNIPQIEVLNSADPNEGEQHEEVGSTY
jgi:hypothetical protein